MGMAAILVMLPRPFIYSFSPIPMRVHINLALIGLAVSEKKMFGNNGYMREFSPVYHLDTQKVKRVQKTVEKL